MPITNYNPKFNERVDWRSDSTRPFNFAILDPPPTIGAVIDWLQVEREAQNRCDKWMRLIGYYSSKAKRETEIASHAQFMQDAQKVHSVNQFTEGIYNDR